MKAAAPPGGKAAGMTSEAGKIGIDGGDGEGAIEADGDVHIKAETISLKAARAMRFECGDSTARSG
jgi:hypothetical protein